MTQGSSGSSSCWSASGSWSPTSTSAALREFDLRDGKVVDRVVPITRVAQYESITRGVKIAQSPTTVVIGRKASRA